MKTTEREVTRHLNNLSSSPSYSSIITIKEMEYWLDNFNDVVFCRGDARRVVFSPYPPTTRVKIHSEKIWY